jgi:TrwC relaxase
VSEVPTVLSLWKLAHGQEAYYLEAVARGVEDYYVGGEAPGRWIASSDTLLGLTGEVSADDLRAVLSGRDPVIWDTARPAAHRARVRPDLPGAQVRVRLVRTR